MIHSHRAALAAVLLFTLFVTGCGNKGPLYLPEPAPDAAPVPPSSDPAPDQPSTQPSTGN